MEGTGYNCEQIEALATVIDEAAQSAASGIVETLHNGVIVPISEAWYAGDAQEYFQGFAETVAESGRAIQEYFDIFRMNVETAGKEWAEFAKGPSPTLSPVSEITLTLPTDEILQQDSNGNTVIIEDKAQEVANGLEEVLEEIQTNLNDIADNLDASTAFLGHGQDEGVKECFVNVSNKVKEVFNYLTEGDNSLQSSINKAVEAYGQSADSISSGFKNAV